MKVILIAAIGKNNAIGKDNRLLWHLPADMKFFKEKTSGHVIITGRKNYESIPEKFRPLPNRINIVITRDKNYKAEGTIVVHSLEEALAAAKKTGDESCYVIGGGQIFEEIMDKNLADELLITHVDNAPEADVFFPEIHADKWEMVEKKELPKDEKNLFDLSICRYVLKKP